MREVIVTKDGQFVALITDGITVVKKGYSVQTPNDKNNRINQLQILRNKINEINKIVLTLEGEIGK